MRAMVASVKSAMTKDGHCVSVLELEFVREHSSCTATAASPLILAAGSLHAVFSPAAVMFRAREIGNGG
jgi:hypothetical protein